MILRNSQKVGIQSSKPGPPPGLPSRFFSEDNFLAPIGIHFLWDFFFHERGAILHHKFLLPQIFGRGGVSGAQAEWKHLKRTTGRVALAFDGPTTPVFSSFEYRVIYRHKRTERGMELAEN